MSVRGRGLVPIRRTNGNARSKVRAVLALHEQDQNFKKLKLLSVTSIEISRKKVIEAGIHICRVNVYYAVSDALMYNNPPRTHLQTAFCIRRAEKFFWVGHPATKRTHTLVLGTSHVDKPAVHRNTLLRNKSREGGIKSVKENENGNSMPCRLK